MCSTLSGVFKLGNVDSVLREFRQGQIQQFLTHGVLSGQQPCADNN